MSAFPILFNAITNIDIYLTNYWILLALAIKTSIGIIINGEGANNTRLHYI